MSHVHRLARLRSGLAGLLVALPLLGIGLAWAAPKARVENPHGRFRDACANCHGADGWKPARISRNFDHAKFGFRLEGAHAAAGCLDCHASLDFSAAKTQCASCHQDPHRGEMGTECSRCHSARSFVDRGPMVRAHQLSRFPLTGSHAALDCESCHHPSAQGQLQFVNTQAECRACHMDDYRGAKSPDHVAGGFPLDCRTCHSASTWDHARFDHARSGFPLTGAHRTTACEGCHTGGRYAGTPRDCASCHQADYDRAQPPHAASGFAASACASCHNTGGWAGAGFDHSTTAFPLTGAHRSTSCASCHGDGVYAGKPSACIACHQADYDRAQPPHAASGFSPTACASCHTTTAWPGATFDHSTTAFPLAGAHATAPCASCHGDGVYHGKSTACQSCHMADYSGAALNHTAAGFAASACASCHTGTTTWTGATYNHAATAFPLTGAHRTTTCVSCHGDAVFATKSTACIACHQTDYNNAVPNHAAAGFATSACATCHTTTAWAGATFDHDSRYFRIYRGGHAGRWAACTDCHTSASNFAVFTCMSCHPHSDKAKTDASHTGRSGYRYDSATCYSCHTR